MKNNSSMRRLFKRCVEFVKDTDSNCVGLYAAQAAFFSALSAIPFVMLTAVSLKHFVNTDIKEIIAPLLGALPETVSVYLSEIITEAVQRSESVTALSVAAVTMLWSSSRGTMAICNGLNRVFGYTKPYTWLRARITSFFYNIIFVAAIVAAVVVLLFGNEIFKFINSYFFSVGYIFTLIFRLKFVVFFVVLVLAFSAAYAFLPQRKAKYTSQFAGAVAAAIGWIVFSYLFSLYIRYFSRYSLLYGSLTALALLMLWVYFCQYMFLAGAQINKSVEKYKNTE